jgi:tripartite-type tricarboxylate transporter receptor subunit TctC
MRSIKCAAAGVVALVCASFTTAVSAQNVESFYRGKTIELHVGFGTGGGNDLWGRALARHMPRYIPGNPTMIVKNVPAAGSLVVANWIASAAPRDGTAIGMIARGIPFEPLFDGKGVQFDPLTLMYLGSPSRDSNMCAVWKDRPFKTAQDMFEREVVLGSTGSGAESHVFPLILKNLLGAKVKIVAGYKGSQDILLAIERGELDGLCLGTETVRRTNQYANGNFRIILQMATEPDPVLGDLPLVSQFAKTDEDRAILNLIFARVDVGRPFVIPPGVPEDRVSALRGAFDATMKDAEFKKDVEKMQLDISAKTGAELEELIRKAYGTPKAIVKRTGELLGG